MGFTGQISAATTKVEATLYVDATYGDDATGERENPGKPYATIGGAMSDVQDGDRVIVNGDLTITSSIIVPNNTHVIFDFLEGSSLTGAINAPLIDDASATSSCELHGRGVFRNDPPATSSSVRIFDIDIDVFGAKSMSSTSGRIFDASKWKNVKNVDEIYVEQLFGVVFQVGINPDHDGINGGVVENVFVGKIGGPQFDCNGIQTTTAGLAVKQNLVLRNVTVTCEGIFGLACLLLDTGTGNLSILAKDCNFIGLNRHRVIRSQGDNNTRFVNCYFENNADLFGVNVESLGDVEFDNCSFKSNGSGVPIFINNNAENNPPKFFGVNKFENAGAAASIILSSQNVECPIYGSILGNKPVQMLGTQQWDLTGVSSTPTPGDDFTVTANDGSTATYTVQGGDTEEDVYDGIISACDAEKSLDANDFKNWTFTKIGAGPFTLRILNTDTDSNYDLVDNESWSWSTTGSDPIVQPSEPVVGGFVHIGGNVDVDDNFVLL